MGKALGGFCRWGNGGRGGVLKGYKQLGGARGGGGAYKRTYNIRVFTNFFESRMFSLVVSPD